MERYTLCPDYPEEFGAKIFKISRDAQGNRLSYMKITGGTLKVKMLLTNRDSFYLKDKKETTEAVWEEKAEQIRIYSGASFTAVQEAKAGTI